MSVAKWTPSQLGELRAVERSVTLLQAEAERLTALLVERGTDVYLLRALLRQARRHLPPHDGYFHNDLIGERAQCETCKLAASIDAQLASKP